MIECCGNVIKLHLYEIYYISKLKSKFVRFLGCNAVVFPDDRGMALDITFGVLFGNGLV